MNGKRRNVTGGLQQKIIDLMLLIIVALIGLYAAVFVFQQRRLTAVMQESGTQQQESIESVSVETMESVLNSSMTQMTALQAYIANELFVEVRSEVLTLQGFAEELFANADSYQDREVAPPSAEDDGHTTVQLVHEEGVDPADSEMLGLMANMSGLMVSMYESSDKLSSVFVGTADGNMILVNDRPSTFVGEDGAPLTLGIRHRPWYAQAEEAGELIFTGVELDAYTDIAMLECAAPVYRDGELAAVVSADIWLTSISDFVESSASEGSFVCVVNEKGQVLFSPMKEGSFKVQLSADAPDLRESENEALAAFVTRALKENTELTPVEIDGREYYVCGVPLETLGWAVLSAVDREQTYRPTELMLQRYDEINDEAMGLYEQGVRRSARTVAVLTVVIVALAISGALLLGRRIVRPLEQLTGCINAQRSGEGIFMMEDAFRTNDEIQTLAEAFEAMTRRTQDYIGEIITITAEKKRIGTELALATRIQADMLPNIYPAFPDRTEFDIYASMNPAKEVGGDFYDYFLIDDDHLCMVVADVSGKGVPAALFMMASRIILANNAMMGQSPAQILTDANASICANNREEMFVTVWLGILELSTGTLTAANAGHEYPAVRHDGGLFELQKKKHGPAIGATNTAKYKQYELKLRPGDRLFVYTDGVPEATAAGNVFFGMDRMLDALNEARDAEPKQILQNVRRAVDDFSENAEQFDDLTMLCLEYRGVDSKTREDAPSEDQTKES